MFDHLDDPRPFTPDDDLRAAAVRRGEARRRRGRWRTGAVSLLATVLGFALAIGGYARWQVSRIDRVSIAAIPQVDLQGNPVAPNVGALDQPFTMLVIGNDDAPDESGRVETNLADSIMLIRVDRPAGTVRVASIPRDTLVASADGGEDRINATRRQGIPALITAINRTFGVSIDHYAEAHFQGFSRLIDAIGGVPVLVDRPVRDRNTGLDLPAGCQVLDGTQALALTRSRHLEVQSADGRWVSDPSSDLGRIDRQQVLGLAAAEHAARQSASGALGSLDALVGTDPSQITLDDHLGVRDLLELSEWVGALPDGAVATSTAAVHREVLASGADVLALDDGAADALHGFLYGTTAAPAPSPPTGPVGTPAAVDGIEPIRVPEGGTCR